MPLLSSLISNSERWLTDRAIHYALNDDYLKTCPMHRENLRLSIAGTSDALLEALEGSALHDEQKISCDDYYNDPLVRFAALEAQKHRKRGINPLVFVTVLKCYRRAYLDLNAENCPARTEQECYENWLHRAFDVMEISICRNLMITTDMHTAKESPANCESELHTGNCYLQVFEVLPYPAMLFSPDGHLENMNSLGHLLLDKISTTTAAGPTAGTGQPGARRGFRATAEGKPRWAEQCPWLAQALRSLLESGRMRMALEFEKELEIEGELHSFAITLRRINGAAGKSPPTIVFFKDITKHRRCENEMASKEARFRQLYEDAPLSYQSLDERGCLLAVNKAWLNFLGYSRDEVIGRHFSEFLTEAYQGYFSKQVPCFKSIGEISGIEFEVKRKDGVPVRVSFHGSMGFGENGELQETHCILSDVTERKRSEERLRESEECFRSAFEYSGIGMAQVGLDGQILQVNIALCKMLGHSVQDLITKKILRFIHPDDRHSGILRVREILDGKRYTAQVEKRLLHKAGNVIWALVNVSLVRDFQGKPSYFIAQLQDITQRRKAEQERSLLAATVEQAAESIAILDPVGIVLYVNPAFEQIIKITKEEVIGRPFPYLDRGYRDRQIFPVLRDILNQGGVWSGCITERSNDGSLREIKTTLSPIRDESGALTNFVAIQRDVTVERKMESKFRQAQKMEALGTLAGGIAHDFNNILTAIIGYSETAIYSLGGENPVQHNLEQILRAGNRAKELVRQILAFSRQHETRRSEIEVRMIVSEALKLLRASLPATIEIRQKFAHKRDYILADSTQIHQVLMNLCTNAAHAMRERGGILEVALDRLELEAELSDHLHLTPGSYLRLTVSDNGHGMDSSKGGIMERIFEPFFTTKGPGEGTGMGLAVVHGIVQSHGGAINVSSEPGKGTTFQVLFPRLLRSAPGDASSCRTEAPRGNERILFVDDEDTLVDVGRRMLERLGYKVNGQTSSIEALELFRASPANFDLVITDQTMPSMTGLDLAAELLSVRADIPVILCSGFSESTTQEKARRLGIREVMLKPLPTYELAVTIRKVLDGK